MKTLEVKSCGWLIDHRPHHIVQVSTDSFNCPGYDSGMAELKERTRELDTTTTFWEGPSGVTWAR